jgi:uncharacterized protein (DUF4415 family)
MGYQSCALATEIESARPMAATRRTPGLCHLRIETNIIDILRQTGDGFA